MIAGCAAILNYLMRRSSGLGFAWLLVVAALGRSGVQQAQAAVTLVSFTASGDVGQVEVKWETATELDNSGFYVQRSDTQNGTYTRVSPFFVSEGDPFAGASYIWIDGEVVNGSTYWYKLESIDLNQNSETHGPVSATPGVQLTATVTRTRTPTGTIDRTASPTVSLTPTNTVTAIPVAASNTPSSAYPAPATVTPLPTGVQLSTITPLPGSPTILPTEPASTQLPSSLISGTLTLVPFPELTLTFPEGGIVLPGHATPTRTPVASTAQTSGSSWIPTGGYLLVGVLVLIWGLLGAWFYLSIRRVE